MIRQHVFPLIVLVSVFQYSCGLFFSFDSGPRFLNDSEEFIISETTFNGLDGFEELVPWYAIKEVNTLQVFSNDSTLFVPSNTAIFLKSDIVGDKALNATDRYNRVRSSPVGFEMEGLRNRYHVLASYVQSQCHRNKTTLNLKYPEVKDKCMLIGDGTGRTSYCIIRRNASPKCLTVADVPCRYITTASCSPPAL